MSAPNCLDNIQSSDCDSLVNAVYVGAVAKVASNEELSNVEEKVYLLTNMLTYSEMEGFISLFDQFFSLRDCIVVEETLSLIGLIKLADLFRRARDIYMGGIQGSLSEDDFHALYLQLSEERLYKINEIGVEILAEGSEIYQIANKLCPYVKGYLYF